MGSPFLFELSKNDARNDFKDALGHSLVPLSDAKSLQEAEEEAKVEEGESSDGDGRTSFSALSLP